MWKNLISVSVGFCTFFYFVTVSFGVVKVKEIAWKEVNRGVKDIDLRAVAVSTDNPDTGQIAVPEPSSIFLLVSGLIGLAGSRKKLSNL